VDGKKTEKRKEEQRERKKYIICADKKGKGGKGEPEISGSD